MAEAEKPSPLKDGSANDTKVMAKNGLFTPALRNVVEKATVLQRYVDQYFRKPNEEKLLADAGQKSMDAG